jgi:hypothetical protein
MDDNVKHQYADIIYNLIPKVQTVGAPPYPQQILLRSSSPQALMQQNEFLNDDD